MALVAGNSWVRAKVGDLRKPGWATGGPVHEFVARHRKALQWAVLALGLLILVIWSNPTTLVAIVVVVITLVVVGLVGLFAGRGPRPATDGPSGSGPGDRARGQPRRVSSTGGHRGPSRRPGTGGGSSSRSTP